MSIGPVAGKPMDFGTVGDIVENRFGEGIGFLENHAHLGPQEDDIDRSVVYVLLVQEYRPGDAADINGVVHPIQAAKKG